jgi:hypothetical protein
MFTSSFWIGKAGARTLGLPAQLIAITSLLACGLALVLPMVAGLRPSGKDTTQEPEGRRQRLLGASRHIKVIGILNMTVGFLGLAWCLGLTGFAWVGRAGVFDTGAKADRHSLGFVPLVTIAGICAVCGTIEVLAGMRLLRGRPGAKAWGILAAILSGANFFVMYLWPLCIASAIYTVLTLAKNNMRVALRNTRED